MLVAGAIVLYVNDASTPSLDETISATTRKPNTAARAPTRQTGQNSAEKAEDAAPLEIRAQLVPQRYTTLGAEIGAKIKRISVTEGQYFRAGEVLVTFDCSIQRSQRDRAKAELAAARKTLAANRELEKLNAVGKLDLDLSASAVDRAGAELRATETVVEKCQITAPFAGRVTAQKAREMQFVQQGQELLEIIDSGALQVEFIAPSNWQPKLKPGAMFDVRIDETGRTYQARLARTGARVDPISQSIKVFATIAGQPHELIAGMSGVASPRF